jgi:hypothetical protein
MLQFVKISVSVREARAGARPCIYLGNIETWRLRGSSFIKILQTHQEIVDKLFVTIYDYLSSNSQIVK